MATRNQSKNNVNLYPGVGILSHPLFFMYLIKIYQQLLKKYGPQGWWPVSCDNRRSEAALFEICVGAILAQSTSWANVEKVLHGLIAQNLLGPAAIHNTSTAKLGGAIKSSGYWRQKTKKLKIFSQFLLKNYAGSFQKMFRQPLPKLRAELLNLWGLGPETVDSMLLYAGQKPAFVIDAYTKRLCQKYGVCFKTYDEYKNFFESRLAKVPMHAKVKLYNEFHALIVRSGKEKHVHLRPSQQTQ